MSFYPEQLFLFIFSTKSCLLFENIVIVGPIKTLLVTFTIFIMPSHTLLKQPVSLGACHLKIQYFKSSDRGKENDLFSLLSMIFSSELEAIPQVHL